MSSPKKRSTLLRLLAYLLSHQKKLLLAFLLTLSSNGLTLVGPLLIGFSVDAISLGKGNVDFSSVFFYCGILLVFYVISSLLSYLLSVLMISISQGITKQMRKEVFEKFSKLPVSYFDSHQTGDLLSRITYDIDTVNTSLSNDLIQISTSILTIVGSLIMMIWISPILLLVFVVTIPAAILITKYMTGKVQPLFRIRSQKLGALNGFVEEVISGQKTIQAYHQEETMKERFSIKNKEAVDGYYHADYYSCTMGPSVNFINNLSLSLVSILGAILYIGNSLTLGKLSSFVLYSRKFSGPINEIANILSELQSAIAAAERVFRLLDEDEEKKDTENAHVFDSVSGTVDFDGINFGYTPEKNIIKNLQLSVSKGNLIAIVGPTGAGKTTIINLLMRFYDPQDGEIRLDTIPIDKGTRKSLRSSFAMVLQDTWLFHGTLFENIAYAKPSATLEEVISVAKKAHIHSFIDRLPEKYDTILDEDGLSLSKGQKQLLTIARAMLMDAKILILDEATSSVDTQTELKIQEAMRSLMKEKTCFVIAHRLSTIQNADSILVIQEGKIIEQGTHETLLSQGGFYAALYEAQFA